MFTYFSKDSQRDEIDRLVVNHEFNRATLLLEHIFSSDTYVIGKEDSSKILLIINGETADVKLQNEYIVRDANIERAYFVLYNYSKKLEDIRNWCEKTPVARVQGVKRDEIEILYIFGELK